MLSFPPVVFARSAGCLIAQTYISSNPAMGLFLLSPPLNNIEMESSRSQDGLPALPTRLTEFNFEPFFPIAIMATAERMELLMKSNQLAQASAVRKYVVKSLQGQQAYNDVQNWFDNIGI